MPLHTSPMTDDLRRQRRNLLVVSGLLGFRKLAGLTVGSVNVLGTSFDLARPDAIGVALWVLWVYAFVRFVQYFREDGLPQLRTAMSAISDTYFQNILAEFVRKVDEEAQGTFTYSNLKKRPFKRTFKGTTSYDTKKGAAEPFELTIPFRCWGKERLHTYSRLLIHTSVTDYLLPWFVSFAVLVYYLVG